MESALVIFYRNRIWFIYSTLLYALAYIICAAKAPFISAEQREINGAILAGMRTGRKLLKMFINYPNPKEIVLAIMSEAALDCRRVYCLSIRQSINVLDSLAEAKARIILAEE